DGPARKKILKKLASSWSARWCVSNSLPALTAVSRAPVVPSYGRTRCNRFTHLEHCLFQTNKDRSRYDVVADVECRNLVDLSNSANISIGQAMSGGHVQSILRRKCRGLPQTSQFLAGS